MSILWLILKIIKFILITLLVVLILVIALITLILVAPIQYEAYASRYNEVEYDIKIRYLIGIKALFKQENDKKNHMIKVFGKTIYKNKVVEEEGSQEGETPDLDNDADEQAPSENALYDIGESEDNVVDSAPEQESVENGTHDATKQEENSISEQEETVTHNTTKQEAIKETHKEDKSNIKEFVEDDGQDLEVVKEVNPELKQEAKESIKEAAEEIKEETVETIEKMPFPWLKRFLLDKTTYKSINLIVKYTWYILKYMAPFEWSYEVVVGRDNPADTGALIAYLMTLYPAYANHGIIRGDFEKACLEGGFLARGKFKIGGILIYVLRCVLSQPVRTMIRLVLKLRKEEKQDGK